MELTYREAPAFEREWESEFELYFIFIPHHPTPYSYLISIHFHIVFCCYLRSILINFTDIDCYIVQCSIMMAHSTHVHLLATDTEPKPQCLPGLPHSMPSSKAAGRVTRMIRPSLPLN